MVRASGSYPEGHKFESHRRYTLIFDASGNRNASAGQNRSAALDGRPMKTVELPAMHLDAVLEGACVDYIKYDVEGSEQEALTGSQKSILAHYPTLMVSLYHRSEDLFGQRRRSTFFAS